MSALHIAYLALLGLQERFCCTISLLYFSTFLQGLSCKYFRVHNSVVIVVHVDVSACARNSLAKERDIALVIKKVGNHVVIKRISDLKKVPKTVL